MLFGNKTAIEFLNSLDSEQLSNYLRTLALVIAFLLVAFRDRKVWFTADLLASVGFGAGLLLAPETLLRFQVEGELDKQLLSLTRLFGAAVLTSAVIWWRTRETRDGTVYITLMVSRIFCCSLILIAMLYSQFYAASSKTRWNSQHVYFSMLGNCLWLLGNLLHLMWSHDFSTYPQHNIPLNAHLRVDAWLTLLASVSMLMFPDVLVKFTTKQFTSTGIHLHVVRATGLIWFGSGIISLQSPGFLHEHDKKSQLINRMVAVAVLGLTLAFNHYWHGVYLMRQMLWPALCVAVVFLNAFIGCFFSRPLSYNKYKVT